MRKTAENPVIRITPRSKALLRTLAKQARKPMQAILDEAVERYQREKFPDQMNAADSAFRRNLKAWKEDPAERALWETTLTDGWSLLP